MKRGLRSIKDMVVFDEEEITDEILQKRVDDITGRIDKLNKHYKTAIRLAEKLTTIPAKKKPQANTGAAAGSWAARWCGFRSSSAIWD